MSLKICSINGCPGIHEARGWCAKHYARWREHGDPLKTAYFDNPEDAFAARTEWQGGCLIWTGYINPDGYGRIRVGDKMANAHRYAWERENGPIPEGMEIDHRDHCNTACVNARHLRLVTSAQNSSNRSGPRKGSQSGVRNVHRHGSGWKVRVVRRGKRHHFGTYSTIEEAAAVAEQARKNLFGEYAGKG